MTRFNDDLDDYYHDERDEARTEANRFKGGMNANRIPGFKIHPKKCDCPMHQTTTDGEENNGR